MATSHRLARLTACSALTAALVAVGVEPAEAWPMPLTGVAGGACRQDGTRQDVVFVVTNLESQFPQSPAVIDNVSLSPNFPHSAFSPQPLPNTGSAHATMAVEVPGDWVGSVHLTYRLFWNGPDGSDIRVGSASISLDYCFPAAVQMSARTARLPATGTRARRVEVRGGKIVAVR